MSNTSPPPLIENTSVAAGFPSPAETYSETPLDLNRLLISKPHATFYVRVRGDSMVDVGIYNNDLLIVDRSTLEPKNGQIIVASVNGEFTLKRFIKTTDGVYLKAENPKYPPIYIDDSVDFQVWGIATYTIHTLKGEP